MNQQKNREAILDLDEMKKSINHLITLSKQHLNFARTLLFIHKKKRILLTFILGLDAPNEFNLSD